MERSLDMKHTMAWWVLTLLTLCLVSYALGNDEILIDDYEDGLDSNWEEKSFTGHNEYTVTREDDRLAVQAVSRASASALIYDIEYNLREFPILEWSWKIEGVISRGDAAHKETDDFAARVYVVFPSWAFWKTTALNYVWANRLGKGEAIPNAFTDNAMMIAVESGTKKVGQWVKERVNVREDYRRYFGKEPPKAGAVAIMTDTDNTGDRATAWYGPVRVLSGKTD